MTKPSTEIKERGVEVPSSKIPSETLKALVESFILREGTDYGVVEVSLETKIEQVLRQIQKGDVKIYFDLETETINLQPSR